MADRAIALLNRQIALRDNRAGKWIRASGITGRDALLSRHDKASTAIERGWRRHDETDSRRYQAHICCAFGCHSSDDADSALTTIQATQARPTTNVLLPPTSREPSVGF